jgi:hypothetical protein
LFHQAGIRGLSGTSPDSALLNPSYLSGSGSSGLGRERMAVCHEFPMQSMHKNKAQQTKKQSDHDEKQDATPDAAHELLLFRMGCAPCLIIFPP